MFDVFLNLLDPLEADAGGTHDQRGAGLDLVPLHPAVRAEVGAPAAKCQIFFYCELKYFYR